MGLLDKLWDDTLAGPRPESGLGRLRKYSSFALRPSSPSAGAGAAKDKVTAAASGSEAAAAGAAAGCLGVGRLSLSEEHPQQEAAPPQVTRSIMIKRPPGWTSPGSSGTPPSSPAGSTPPVSPFAGGGRFRRRSMSDVQGRRPAEAPASTSSSYPPFEV